MSAQPYLQTQPAPIPVTAPPVGGFGPSRNYVGLIMVGIIIIMIGGIIYISSGFVDDPDDYSDIEDYTDTVRLITTVGNLILFIGIILLSMGLINGALKDDSLHPNIRLGMLIAMGLIIGFRLWSFISL
jgi:hypothetical protein